MALPAAGTLCCRVRWSLRVFPTYRRHCFRAAGAPQIKSGWLGLSVVPSPCAVAASPLLPPVRSYSSDPGRGEQQKKVVVVGIPNPFVWFQTRLFFFFIRAYFDQEFSIHEFTQGAKQAFALVSKLISQCKYDLLEELVSKEVLQVLKEKVSSLSENHRSALAADEIMYTTARDVGIYYDDKGRKFVSILMGFWYLTSVDLPDETPDSTKVFQVAFTDKPGMETKRLLTANYEFKREFTQGVKPDWTITRIEHPKLLE